MAKKRDELLKARTCEHANEVGKLGSVFVKPSCPNDKKLSVKTKKGKVYVIRAARCNDCLAYKKGIK